ncbi:DNA-binding protein (plasmid) [Ectopseudomonas mendocina]
MRPPEVHDDQIIAAGTQIEAQGKRITGHALRQLIGNGTPARLMKVWAEHKRGTTPAPEDQPLPTLAEQTLRLGIDQMTSSMQQLLVSLNASCQQAANAKIASIEEAADAQCAVYIDELNEASERIQAANEARQLLERTLTAREDKIIQLSNQLAAEQERNRQGEAALATHKAESKAELQAVKEAHAQQQQQLAQELAAARQEAKDAEQRALATASRLQQLESEATFTAKEHAAETGRLQAELETAQSASSAATKAKELVQVTCDAVTEQLNKKSMQFEVAQAQIKGQEERIVELCMRIEEYRGTASSQAKHIARLELKIDQLEKERQQLSSSRQQGKNE